MQLHVKRLNRWFVETQLYLLRLYLYGLGLTQNISQTLISPCRASCYNGEAARSSPLAPASPFGRRGDALADGGFPHE
jgi:hypothetical protein